jgi:hypothetical protein
MPTPPRIRVMISSRCNDTIEFDGVISTLSDVRARLKHTLEDVELLGSQIFDVWINEDAPPAEGDEDSWEHCLAQVRDADIVLVLYNGNAGWAKEDGDIGICHAEIATALGASPAKVRLVELPLADNAVGERNQRFQAYVTTQSLFRGAAVANGEQAIERCKQALRDAVASMIRLGVREARKGKLHTGEALDWSRLDYHDRYQAMVSSLRNALHKRARSQLVGDCVLVKVGGKPVLFCCHAVPAAMSQSAARELVGQPFLSDHERITSLTGSRVGPVHLIAAHRTVTESQVIRMLGYPDAVIVFPPFGVYVADPLHKIQLVFVKNCVDDTATRHGVQRFFEWLDQSGESELFAVRASSRKQIVKALAKEM